MRSMRAIVPLAYMASLVSCGDVTVDPLRPTSCRGVLASSQTRPPSGLYEVRRGGSEAATPVLVECDFSDGAPWTVIRRETFDHAVPDGLSRAEVTECGGFGRVLGGYETFGNEAVTWGVPTPEPHTELRIQFDFLILDSWDGELAFFEVDGTRAFERRCDKDPVSSCNQVSDECGWTGPGRLDGRLPVAVRVSHTAPTATLTFGAVLDQSTGDESWGVDNVVVSTR